MTVKVAIRFIDGGYVEYEYDDSLLSKYRELVSHGLTGKSLINTLITDDWAAPPSRVTINAGGNLPGDSIELFYG